MLGGTTMENKQFLDVKDVAEYMSISTSKAYKVMRNLNDELKAKGYIVIAGKVSRAYFEEKIYGVSIA
jgi:Mn-dependent DtxR family transcriptional regulator